MNKNSKIYIAGHLGMVGSAIHRQLAEQGYTNLITRSKSELNLLDQAAVDAFFASEKPEYVIDAAAKVGGIMANSIYRAQFLYENLTIQDNIIHSAWKYGVKKLLFLGSSCIYPREAPQPLKEEYLLTGPLEPTNEPYAIAKITGIKMCEGYYRQYGSNFISVMPTNLYGPNDNYDLESSHVLPALIRKFHLARCLELNDWQAIRRDLTKRPINGIKPEDNEQKILEGLERFGIVCSSKFRVRSSMLNNEPLTTNPEPQTSNLEPAPPTPSPEGEGEQVLVRLWGTGQVFREFLHVDDMASACVHILEHVEAKQLYDELKVTHINIGTGRDMTIREIAELVKKTIGFTGETGWDPSKPDGMLKKQLDVTRLNSLGWRESIPLEEGIKSVYQSYIN